MRVDDLLFSPTGELWGTSWPDRGILYKFDLANGRGTSLMVQFNANVDSIAFGKNGTALEGLLFVSEQFAGYRQPGVDHRNGRHHDAAARTLG